MIRGRTSRLEVKSQFRCQRTRRHVVRAAESRKEVIERVFVGDIDRGNLQADFVLVTAEKVVLSQRDVEHAPRRNALRIVIVVLLVRGRYRNEVRPKL